MQDEVFGRRETAVKADQRLGLKYMGARPKPLRENEPDAPRAFVEASQRDGRGLDGPSKRGQATRSRSLIFIVSN